MESIINSFEDFKKQAVEIITHWEAPEARELLLKFDAEKLESLKASDFTLYSRYKRIQALLKITAIPVLPKEEVLDLVRNNIIEGFHNELDFSERIGLKLLVLPELVRDGFKEQVLKAMISNEQRLGLKLVKDWILDYNKDAGAKKHNSVERTEYMIRDKSAQQLSETDKIVLRNILTLYDEMKVEMVKNDQMATL